jgi:hypothetical protein
MTEKGVRLAEIMATRVARYEKSGANEYRIPAQIGHNCKLCHLNFHEAENIWRTTAPNERDAMGLFGFSANAQKVI